MRYVYLLLSFHHCKIGSAGDIEGRIAQLQTGNPYPIELAAAYGFDNPEAVERSIQQKFSSKRVRNEWFNLTAADVDEFHKICSMLGGDPFSGFDKVTEKDVENAEEIQEGIFDGDVRVELRKDHNGQVRGIVFRERNDARKAVGYIGKRNEKFSAMLEKIIKEPGDAE